MSVRRDGSVVYLEGDCPVQDAEALAAFLEERAGMTVDLSQCRQLHTALVQALLRFRPSVQGAPDSAFVRDTIIPALRAGDV